MPHTRKQVRVIYVWLVLGALISLFPPQEVEERITLQLSNEAVVSTRPWFYQGFVLSSGERQPVSSGNFTHEYFPKGIRGATLCSELLFVTFVSGIFYFAFRIKEGTGSGTPRPLPS